MIQQMIPSVNELKSSLEKDQAAITKRIPWVMDFIHLIETDQVQLPPPSEIIEQIRSAYQTAHPTVTQFLAEIKAPQTQNVLPSTLPNTSSPAVIPLTHPQFIPLTSSTPIAYPFVLLNPKPTSSSALNPKSPEVQSSPKTKSTKPKKLQASPNQKPNNPTPNEPPLSFQMQLTTEDRFYFIQELEKEIQSRIESYYFEV
jgi:hypothetical protein